MHIGVVELDLAEVRLTVNIYRYHMLLEASCIGHEQCVDLSHSALHQGLEVDLAGNGHEKR